MRRWNGWGDSSQSAEVPAQALAWLAQRVGAGLPVRDNSLQELLAEVKPSRLPVHALISQDPAERLRVGLGESYRDWICRRTGTLPPLPDGVAFVESSEQVRELLDLAQSRNWLVIPYAGGTSVAGHLDCPISERPVLSVNLGRMNRLLHLDPLSQLARFGAGTSGPQVEAQLRAHGYTLGHFPQSFEYSTVGGWVVTRSSGQQSLRFGRIEQLFAGGRFEAPIGTLNLPTLPAASAGPDLREIILGSEGRFGVLTEVEVRVTPVPEHDSYHAVFLPDWDRAEAAVRALVQRRLPLSMLRLNNAGETVGYLAMAGHASQIKWLERYLGWRGCAGEKCWLTMGVTGERRPARQALAEARRVLRQFGGVYLGTGLGSKWSEGRFKGPYLRNTLWEQGYSVDTIETAVDWPQVKKLMLAMEAAAHQAFGDFGIKVHAGTHLSHVYAQGSSIYSTFIWPTAPGGFEPNLERWRHFKTRLSSVIAEHGGTVSHQHGVGRDHAAFLQVEKGPLGMATLADLCRHFDPKRIMNPGKLLADGEQWAH
ncbi:MAG: FAD-binding oxidoreductase [Rhodoferax sp.]